MYTRLDIKMQGLEKWLEIQLLQGGKIQLLCEVETYESIYGKGFFIAYINNPNVNIHFIFHIDILLFLLK